MVVLRWCCGGEMVCGGGGDVVMYTHRHIHTHTRADTHTHTHTHTHAHTHAHTRVSLVQSSSSSYVTMSDKEDQGKLLSIQSAAVPLLLIASRSDHRPKTLLGVMWVVGDE